MPSEIEIAVRDDTVFVAGQRVEALSSHPELPTALTRLLASCLATPHRLAFQLDAQASAASTRALLNQVPLSSGQVDSLRFGNSPPNPVKLASPSWVAGHWVRVSVHADRIEATELERADSEPGAPNVIREARPKNLAAAYAFIHDSCARKECLGVILFLDGQSKNAVIESALAAARTTHVPEPLLAVRDSDAVPGEHDNDFRALKVAGRLPPELIQAVVRKSYGLFRGCYERGLGLNPALKGKITARFVIDRDGTVTHVSDAGSDLPDAETVSCIISQFYKMKFPFPEDGIVTVVYPIMLSPG